MSGLDDNVAIIGDWIPYSQNNEQSQYSGSKEMQSLSNNKDDGQLNDESNQTGSFDYQSNSRGSLVERMAARAGFTAPRLNTEGIRPNDVLNSDSQSSPLLTIPPGLSPTSLLESPVLLSDSLAQPSPTTGKFPFFSTNGSYNNNTSRGFLSKDIGSASFAFKPSVESAPSFFGSGSNGNELMFPQQSLSFPRINNSSQSENSISLQPHTEPSKMQPPRMFETVPEHVSDDRLDEEGGEQKGGNGDSVGGGPSSKDCYNWRKYGQKQVKCSEFPRSYYKCTSPNCSVKRKVESSQEGRVTEIHYKGAHNHPKRPPSRAGPDNSDGEAGYSKQDNFEVTSSPSEGPDFGGSGLHGQNGSGQLQGGSAEGVDGSSTFSNEEAEDDQATNGSVSLGNDAEGEESESKRRKIEVSPIDMSGATRAFREPRIVVQTTSDVDILDDGYRWRKYGQKVVKGNPNPRSYYKCTSSGCTVRKHVERASHDLNSVITTYEGKHNHEIPAARNSSHGNSGASGSAQPVQAQAHRPEHPMVHNVLPRLNGSGPLTSFGLPGRPLNLGHGFGQFGMGGPNLSNFGLGGLGPGHGRMPVGPFLAQQQQRQLSEVGFMMQNVEPGSQSNSAYMYQQMMNRLSPLGPQM